MVAITDARRADTWSRRPGLDLSPEAVARLTAPEREERVRLLLEESREIIAAAKEDLVGDLTLVGTAILYSGGNDSTTLAHALRGDADFAIHANTGIGVEQTRQFVRDTCEAWGLPLYERHAPAGSTFRELVLDQGFPGPAQHFKMYQRLKERPLMQVRRELVTKPRRERIIFFAGRRQEESARRADVSLYERQGSIVWVSPLVFWHKVDLNTYRLMNPDVPRNEVSDLLHMSGECLCGAFAKRDELDEIGFFFPEVKAEIEALQQDAVAAGVPAERCVWGWGANRGIKPKDKSGPLCSSCDARATGGEVVTS